MSSKTRSPILPSYNPNISSPSRGSGSSSPSPGISEPMKRSGSGGSGSRHGHDGQNYFDNGYVNSNAEKGQNLYEQAKQKVEIIPNLPEEKTKKSGLSPALIIPIWIALSSAVILYNKYLYSNLNYPYPIFITSYHLGCAALGTRVLRVTTNLMNGLDKVEMTRELYLKSILPIGVLFSGSLILSNTAYLTLSVSFIQMLKAFTPVAILLISAIFKLQVLTSRLVMIVLLISTGCALAAYGELHFEMFGFLCQVSAVAFESSRLVMIQILLQGLKMDPLCSLHYYAPVCAIINACFLPFTEGLVPFREYLRIGPLIMISNAAVAFGLNVAAVFLIGAAGGLVLTLAGVFKDILLISSSVIFFGSPITSVQIFGYSLALGGMVAYKTASK
ncbi:uncharacterized protein I206_103522 [Kwoniella pini CBS 10737]|uniref:Sugar phosphate transporter domain-containing protein n=1 Tax=Kwoniella pini CBS 10737 TaxID=1296096 RepID=A0A1B9I9F4_9TREE|nr:uncharacterized protein I206_01474 [Kwoniella pini CBS 10737]OCF52189.1 hypothetical protein I206_01474 [Kwoniella pini CBS 10737]